MEEISFKQRIINVASYNSILFYDVYVQYDYLIVSEVFRMNPYYIISAHEDNYLHLIGVNSKVSPQEFFEKCIKRNNKQLREEDFDFNKPRQNEKSVKGSVRRKIKCLDEIFNLLSEGTRVEEDFKKNRIHCSFASSNPKCTLGFTTGTRVKPETLLNGSLLDDERAGTICLLLRKKKNESKFSDIIIGNDEVIKRYKDVILEELNTNIIERLKI